MTDAGALHKEMLNEAKTALNPDSNSAGELLKAGAGELARAGIENPRLDAGLILAYALNTDRLGVMKEPERALDARQLETFEGLLARRAAREPLAYIFGHKEFFSLNFAVNRSVLIPRPETEILVERAIAWIDANAQRRPAPLLADIGTGSGAIAVAAAHARPSARWIATDVSEEALNVARENAERHGFVARIEFRLGSFFEPLHCFCDAIFCNPPYIEEDAREGLQPEVRDWEPAVALFGGGDGLDCLRALIAGAPRYLKKGGLLGLEIGCVQSTAVAGLLEDTGAFADIEILADLAGHPRCVFATRA